MLLQPGTKPIPNSADYVLVRKLGSGAFGQVWQARGPGGLDLALKFILLELQTLRTEIRSLDAVKSIKHPNLVSLLGVWLTDGFLILGMELCECTLGDQLRHALDRNLPGIPREELLGYMNDAANGLDALNEKRVQHRDVKPSNLLLQKSKVKVADYGLAKVLAHTLATNTGGGTIAYMAPECFRGNLTAHSDQYSLAATYYELRSGTLLFQGDQAQIMYGHLEGKPDLVALTSPEQRAVARALSKKPDDRWPNCKAFVSALIVAHGEQQRQELQRSIEKKHQSRSTSEELNKIGNVIPRLPLKSNSAFVWTICSGLLLSWGALCIGAAIYNVAFECFLGYGLFLGLFPCALVIAEHTRRKRAEREWCEVTGCTLEDLKQLRKDSRMKYPRAN